MHVGSNGDAQKATDAGEFGRGYSRVGSLGVWWVTFTCQCMSLPSDFSFVFSTIYSKEHSKPASCRGFPSTPGGLWKLAWMASAMCLIVKAFGRFRLQTNRAAVTYPV